MSNNIVKIAAVGLLWLPLAVCNAAENAIVRIAKNPPTPTLDAVLLPPGAEILLLSGQTPAPLDPKKIDGPDDFGDTRTQTLSVFTKIKTLLEKQGFSMRDIVKLTVFVAGEPKLGGKADFAAMNEVYGTFFGTAENPHLPARTALQVAAFGRAGYRVEIEAIAARTSAN